MLKELNHQLNRLMPNQAHLLRFQWEGNFSLTGGERPHAGVTKRSTAGADSSSLFFLGDALATPIISSEATRRLGQLRRDTTKQECVRILISQTKPLIWENTCRGKEKQSLIQEFWNVENLVSQWKLREDQTDLLKRCPG